MSACSRCWRSARRWARRCSISGCRGRAARARVSVERECHADDLHHRPFDPRPGRADRAAARDAIERLVDVRAVPRSRHNPQFNAGTLERAARCRHRATATTRRSAACAARAGKASPNRFWKPGGLPQLRRLRMTRRSARRSPRLKSAGREPAPAIMCAEAHWRNCHRRIIADYLLADGDAVSTSSRTARREPAKLTAAAVRGEDGTLHLPGGSRRSRAAGSIGSFLAHAHGRGSTGNGHSSAEHVSARVVGDGPIRGHDVEAGPAKRRSRALAYSSSLGWSSMPSARM